MTTLQVDLSLEQLKKVLQQLPPQDKIDLWRLLDAEMDRTAIAKRFADALQTIRKAHVDISEDKVMADILKATRQVRTKRYHAKNRS